MSDATGNISEDAPDEAPSARGRSVRGDKALDSINFQSRTTGAKAAARSRLVKRLRIALPIFAVILVLALVFTSGSNPVDSATLDEFSDIAAATEELRMSNPSFSGIDSNGKPYEITAEAALQNPAAKDVVQLQHPRAVQGGNGEDNSVTALSGRYMTETNILELNDEVTFRHELGAKTYVLRSPSAVVTVKDQVVSSDAGVGAVGPDGANLKADRMKAYRDDGRVVFEGNVSMRIYPSAARAEKTTPALRDGNEEEKEQ